MNQGTRRPNRDRRFGCLVFGGLVVGALVGMAFGAMFGVAVWWFAAAAALEKAGKSNQVNDRRI